MVTYVKGDLLVAEADALVNTVNTVGVMGKGIALQFKQAFPYNYERYREACRNGELDVGELLIVKDQHLIYGEKLIVNFPTKKHGKQLSEYSYIESGLVALTKAIQKYEIKSLAIPALGCGNGGLDWQIVKRMIEKYFVQLNVRVYVFEPE